MITQQFHTYIPRFISMNIRIFALIILLFSMPNVSHADEYVNFNKMNFTSIPQGTFLMGSCNKLLNRNSLGKCGDGSFNDTWAFVDELPRHRVEITKKLQIGTYPVTAKQYGNYLKDSRKIHGNNDIDFSLFNSDMNASVRYVSWNDAQLFLEWLNKKKPRNDKATYRLPTEAEWEYASRAGTNTIYFFGNSLSELSKYAQYRADMDMSNGGSTEETSRRANPWGIFDIYGNVWEWVSDWYDAGYYEITKSKDPQGPVSGKMRVIRGGASNFDSSYCRSAARESYPPQNRSRSIGFRVVRELVGE